jgi:uncharacterized RDD family membrane protein YckC
MNDPNAPGGQQMPPASPPPPPPGPGPAGWQSTPQQPGPPPMGGGQPGGGMPAWGSNLTARNTIAGPGGVALADTPSRFIAAFIDFIILGIIGYIVNTIMTGILGDNYLGVFGLNYRSPSLISSLVTVVIMLAVSAGYFIYQWSRMNGMTVGNRVLKLSVRDAASGGPVTQQQAITRWMYLGAPWALTFFYGWTLGIIISLLALVYYIYLLYTMAQSPTRQGLQDQQAKTVVAKLG